jgi:hypothetical protein
VGSLEVLTLMTRKMNCHRRRERDHGTGPDKKLDELIDQAA